MIKVLETRVTGKTIHIWLADDPELHKATAWLEAELPLAILGLSQGHHPLDDLRRAMLRTIRIAIEGELDRLAKPSKRKLPAKILERQAQRRARRA